MGSRSHAARPAIPSRAPDPAQVRHDRRGEHDVSMSEDAPRRRWALPALLSGIGLVVVIAVVVIVARGGPQEYPADTPEGVVQRYSQALIDGDFEGALEYVVPEIADDCERDWFAAEDYRVALVRTTERDSGTTVDVLITAVYGSGLLGPGESESEGSFLLVQEDGEWLIERAPWQLSLCGELGL